MEIKEGDTDSAIPFLKAICGTKCSFIHVRPREDNRIIRRYSHVSGLTVTPEKRTIMLSTEHGPFYLMKGRDTVYVGDTFIIIAWDSYIEAITPFNIVISWESVVAAESLTGHLWFAVAAAVYEALSKRGVLD